jgi:hypothetical protein
VISWNFAKSWNRNFAIPYFCEHTSYVARNGWINEINRFLLRAKVKLKKFRKTFPVKTSFFAAMEQPRCPHHSPSHHTHTEQSRKRKNAWLFHEVLTKTFNIMREFLGNRVMRWNQNCDLTSPENGVYSRTSSKLWPCIRAKAAKSWKERRKSERFDVRVRTLLDPLPALFRKMFSQRPGRSRKMSSFTVCERSVGFE